MDLGVARFTFALEAFSTACPNLVLFLEEILALRWRNQVFAVTLKSAGSPVGAFPFQRPNDQATFVGVWSTLSFDRIEIRETTGGLENEFFGQFYTGTTPIPEPSTLTLLALGTLGLLGYARRRRK